MPALKPHELSTEPGDRECSADGCSRTIACTPDGWELPFCKRCLVFVPRHVFNALITVASRSLFDADAVSEAFRLIAQAKRRIPKRLVARWARAVR